MSRIYKSGKESHLFIDLTNKIYRQYKNSVKNRNLVFDIEFDTFLNLITKKCYYCGSEPKINLGDSKYFQTGKFERNGLDRIDSKLGYVDNNVVTCCETCNRAKLSMSEEEFYSWINQLYNYLKLNRKTFNDYSERKYIQANGNGDNP